MFRASALSVLCAVIALAAGGCGESGSAGGDGPASLVPAKASLYAEVTVQPQGDLREDALAAAGKVMRTDDPAAKLRELIDKSLAEEDLTWERDFAPWLGEDVGVWASNLSAAEPSYAVIVASKDAEAAAAALARLEKADDDATYTKRSYDGIDYMVDQDGVADGVIDDYVVIGTEDAFKRTADTRDGDKLVDSDGYDDVVGELEEDRLGHLYFDAKGVLDATVREDPEAAEQLEQMKSLLPLDEIGPSALSLRADGDRILLDTLSVGIPEGALRELVKLSAFVGGDLLTELPGDSWGSFVLPDVGQSAQSLFSTFAGALGAAAATAEVKRATGLDLHADVFSWIGDVGAFVRGADVASLDGAVVIESTDDERAEAAFAKIIALIAKESGTVPRPANVDGADAAFAIELPDAPKPLVLARGEGRVVAAYGQEAASAALAPDAKLGDSEDYGAASEILGDDVEPAFLLSMPDVMRLVDATVTSDTEYRKVRPYLEAFGVVTSGGSADGDTVRSRIGVTLK